MISSAHAVLVFSLFALLTATGCEGGRGNAGREQLSVFAASSLTDAFGAIEKQFEAHHPNVDVFMTFAGSQALRLGLEQGAQADLFASANEDHMRALVGANVVAQTRTFAFNELVVIVPRDNPARIRSFEDLPRAKRLVIGSNNVPAGIYARQVLGRAKSRWGADFAARVQRHVVSEESNVRLVRAKVELDEADAAFVYRTDAVSSDNLRVVPIPSDLNVRASYPIGLVAHSRHERAARQFIDFLLSKAGQRSLARYGFLAGAP